MYYKEDNKRQREKEKEREREGEREKGLKRMQNGLKKKSKIFGIAFSSYLKNPTERFGSMSLGLSPKS